jgi:hypothetical protein
MKIIFVAQRRGSNAQPSCHLVPCVRVTLDLQVGEKVKAPESCEMTIQSEEEKDKP